MGLEVSRLARNSTDWHRLLEICALTDTLILDEDGIYDPAHFNDRLLLGLKGTMSEAELHVLRARLIGGILNKARRGELQCRVPIGLVYDAAGRVVLDPDQQVQHTIRVLFETFRRTGSATATVKSFRDQGLSFPRRMLARRAQRRGDLGSPRPSAHALGAAQPALRGRVRLRAHAAAHIRRGSTTSCRGRNGWRSSAMPIRATSAGTSSNSIRRCSATMPRGMAPIGGGVRPAKARRSCRASSSAASAACG